MSEKKLSKRLPLFTTLFGSRLYGTNTPESDLDWKEVYVPNIDLLLIGTKITNVVQSTGNDHTRNTKDDIDWEYIPIQVFAKDFLEGQTYAIEMAFSVLSEEYKASQQLHVKEFKTFVEELVSKFLTSNVRSMIGYAMNQAQIYGIKGTRLSSVRKFHTHLVESLASGKIKNEDRLECLYDWVNDPAITDKYLFVTHYENVGKMYPGISLLEKIFPVSITIEETLERVESIMQKYGSRAMSSEKAKGIDWKATSHALRISNQAVELLTTHKLTFPFDHEYAEELLRVKLGELPYEDVEAWLTNSMELIDRAKETTTLPAKSEQMVQEFEAWLVKWMRHFYDITDSNPSATSIH